MISSMTVLNVADNSGAKKIICITVLGGSKRKFGSVGDIITASVRSAIPSGSVKKGEVVRAIIVRSKYDIRRKDGSHIRFGDNAAVLINKRGNFSGTRINGAIAREVKNRHPKIAAIAAEIL